MDWDVIRGLGTVVAKVVKVGGKGVLGRVSPLVFGFLILAAIAMTIAAVHDPTHVFFVIILGLVSPCLLIMGMLVYAHFHPDEAASEGASIAQITKARADLLAAKSIPNIHNAPNIPDPRGLIELNLKGAAFGKLMPTLSSPSVPQKSRKK